MQVASAHLGEQDCAHLIALLDRRSIGGYKNVKGCESPKWKACCKYDDRGTICVLRVKILFKKNENICLYIERRISSLPVILC